MAPALGLSLYLLANRGRSPEALDRPAEPRPEGLLLWIVAEPPTEGAICLKLAETLLDAGLCDHVMISGVSPASALPAQTRLTPPPPDLPDQVVLFLDHWKPDAVLVLGDVLRPACLADLLDRKTPVILANSGRAGLPDGRSWYPGLVSALLGGMAEIHVTSDAALRAFRKAGARQDRLRLTAPLDEDGHCLPCTEAERHALSAQFGTRPVWLAASVPTTEDKAVLQAHLTALRATHRLLLVLVPDDAARADEIARVARDDYGLSVARRSLEDDPDDDVQVYLADTEGEYGLWYRLAPLCYMGGTLTSGADRTLRHPFEPAALGSAILHGPFLGPRERPYVRLRAAGATRIVPSGADLGETVSDLLEPDRAARLAQAAWALLARSAQASDELLDTLRAVLTPHPKP